jgi:hypothetical protein
LDGLALVYLQYTNLLTPFLHTFHNVYIHATTLEEATLLIEHDKNVANVLQIIDTVRNVVRQANNSGKVIFGPKGPPSGDAERDDAAQSTINLFQGLSGAEIAVMDDRFLNKEPFIVDRAGARATVASTLDIIEELVARNVVSDDERINLRYRLRVGGAMLMPLDAKDILAAVRRNRQTEAPEFRAIQDSIDLARLSEMPQFPAEMPWFMGYARGSKEAITAAWQEETPERAIALSEAIDRIRPIPEDWIARWNGNPPPGWITAVRRALTGALALPVELPDGDRLDAYQRWLEGTFTSEMRRLRPESHQQLVEYLRDFINKPWDDDDED